MAQFVIYHIEGVKVEPSIIIGLCQDGRRAKGKTRQFAFSSERATRQLESATAMGPCGALHHF
jgi:hypothetical protein